MTWWHDVLSYMSLLLIRKGEQAQVLPSDIFRAQPPPPFNATYAEKDRVEVQLHAGEWYESSLLMSDDGSGWGWKGGQGWLTSSHLFILSGSPGALSRSSVKLHARYVRDRRILTFALNNITVLGAF